MVMIKKILLSILLFTMLLLIINGQQGCQQAECFSDDDCVKVQTTCCSCNMGGQELCMSKVMASIYKQKLEQECPKDEPLICPAVYNCQIEKCVCVRGVCKAIE